MNYWWSYIRAVLPGSLWMSMCVLPTVAGVVLAGREFRGGRRSRGVVFVVASLAAGLASVLMVGPFLLSEGSGSSTDALVWVFAPFFSGIVLAVAVFVGQGVIRLTNQSSPACGSPFPLKVALLGPPVIVACLLAFGIARYTFQNGGMKVAERASDPEILRELYRREGEASSSSGLQLFLAQNRATPGDVLDALSRTEFVHVRVHVAANSSTPLTTRTRLATDTNPRVRASARSKESPTP